MLGRDTLSHAVTIEASSPFDAADKAIQAWARLWWFDPHADVTVRIADKEWRVTQA
jgi:hypothetical protein